MDKQQREYIHHLMLQYSDAMVRLTYRRVGDWHLAEDLVQETFLTACCKSERVCGHKKPVAWLFETLNNLTLRESRRFYHTEVSIEDIAESYELTELPMACHIPMGLSGSEQEIILLSHR
jgi:DNA-directed RNA polymerase specialized sigma24 family protein